MLESSPHPGNNIPEYTFQAEGLILQLCEEIRATAIVSGRDDAVMEELRESCRTRIRECAREISDQLKTSWQNKFAN